LKNNLISLSTNPPLFRGKVTLWFTRAKGLRFFCAAGKIRIWGSPAAVMNFVLLGWMLGMQNARGPLSLLLVSNLSNVLLDIWFVMGLHMGVEGVAWASVISQYTALALGLFLVKRMLGAIEKPEVPVVALLRDGWRDLRWFLAVNRDIFLRSLLLMLTFSFFTQQSAGFGELVLAANAVLLKFLMLELTRPINGLQ
jgi:MATE family multidrug resistance protein